MEGDQGRGEAGTAGVEGSASRLPRLPRLLETTQCCNDEAQKGLKVIGYNTIRRRDDILGAHGINQHTHSFDGVDNCFMVPSGAEGWFGAFCYGVWGSIENSY